ncbi:MAG: CoA transferase [Dermatophilaceae bacterium]
MNGPLDGISLVSVALNIPGPVAVARLVEMGASATTVLPPAGDPLQIYRQAWFDELHRDHDVLTLDLKQDAERRQMHALLAQADVFLTSSRPSALRRLGLDFEKLVARHPRLCQVDIVGYPGDAGEVAGHDLTYQAVHGLVRGEQLPPTLSVDLMGAERAVTEVLAVLRERPRSGVGARRQVVLSEMADLLSAPLRHGLTTPGGLLGGGLPLYGVYPAQEGRVALAALEPHFARALVAALAGERWAAVGDESAESELTTGRLREVFAQRTSRDWEEWAQRHGIPLVAVADPRAID